MFHVHHEYRGLAVLWSLGGVDFCFSIWLISILFLIQGDFLSPWKSLFLRHNPAGVSVGSLTCLLRNLVWCWHWPESVFSVWALPHLTILHSPSVSPTPRTPVIPTFTRLLQKPAEDLRDVCMLCKRAFFHIVPWISICFSCSKASPTPQTSLGK